MTHPVITCDEAQALMGDLLDGTLSDTQRASYDAHAAACAGCRDLARDLAQIRQQAASLPTLTPSRDLWAGIEARLDRSVVAVGAFGARRRGPVARWTTTQVAAAAAVLIAATAGGTWRAATRAAGITHSASQAASAGSARTQLVAVADQQGIATYESEIAKLHNIIETRRGELDSGTVVVLEKNLRLIDRAIAKSRAALAADPASAFLADRLNRSYDTKLELLRSAAMLPSRS